MRTPKYRLNLLFSRLVAASTLILSSSLSSGVAPIEAHFIMGMDVQGQRLNLYKDCEEGYVTCDNMLLVAGNVGQLLQISEYGKRLGQAPDSVILYPANTKHSLCKDGVTPCMFQGYRFEGEDFNGFVDTARQEITISSHWTTDTATLPYQENATYLPLVSEPVSQSVSQSASQSKRIDRLYQVSDQALNDGYKTARSDVKRLYGSKSANDLYKEQIAWIKQRSDICGADIHHLPRSQAEKVCFIQKNDSRMTDYFLWVD